MIVLEGNEATGKSTQAALLAETLGAVLTREPGGTDLGERLRGLLLDPDLQPPIARAEALLMLAARAQHVGEVIIPALEQGRWVVCDRYSASTLVYQGYGRGLEPDDLATMSTWAAMGVEPDRIVLLTVDRATARARRASSLPDRFEQEHDDFYDRVDAGYAALAKADTAHWRVVDATGTVDEVAARVAEAVADLVG